MTLLQQYRALKSIYPDALLLIRTDNDHVAFDEDAKTVAAVLGLSLEVRAPLVERIPTDTACRFSSHRLEHYLQKLVRMGYKVAVAELVDGNVKITHIVVDE
jgi:DNA mismatch repair ATPase MutS